MWSFPASFMAEFFDNHGMYSLRDRPQWRTVSGGSRSYVEAITAPWRDRVRLRRAGAADRAAAGRGADRGRRLRERGLRPGRDRRPLRPGAGDARATRPRAEREVLGAIPYQRNEAVLHTDRSLMPRRRAAWSSWNFHLCEQPPPATTVTYWMNHLQRLPREPRLLPHPEPRRGDRPGEGAAPLRLRPPRLHRGRASPPRRATPRSAALDRRTHYCGAYWGWGFHEDGVVSGLRVAAALRGAPAATPAEAPPRVAAGRIARRRCAATRARSPRDPSRSRPVRDLRLTRSPPSTRAGSGTGASSRSSTSSATRSSSCTSTWPSCPACSIPTRSGRPAAARPPASAAPTSSATRRGRSTPASATRSRPRPARAPPARSACSAGLRYLGHSFNPVSFYYCFDPAGERVEASSPRSRTFPGASDTPMFCERGERVGPVLSRASSTRASTSRP